MDLPDRYVRTADVAEQGGMSTAISCNDTHLNRTVLIKELQDDIDQRRLIDEVTALAAIRSKHVVQIYDVIRDVDGGIVGLVEEYLPGDDLNAIIPLTDGQQVLRIAYAIAAGLADIHEAGRVHRDIKPGNMKFDAEGCLKIFDFGLARTQEIDARTEGAIGTRGYMAPELCVDDYDEVEFTGAVDTYAFAATILKLIRGTLPAPMRRPMPVLTAESQFANQPLVMAPDICTALDQCFAEEPEDRPSMATIRDLIGRHLLRDQHRAALIANNTVYTLNSTRRSVAVNLGRFGNLTLAYDGLGFRVSAATGAVFVNNIRVNVPHDLPGACVITAGEPEEGARRIHMTLDVSHPEFVS